ncbi:hypothetical protein EV421DRAFT_1766800 [Armillaria borealis]|uniref:Uncharacterized protein n=1 Tax=Armillaria borealis TaxID=47425 RepID=A0AA39N0V7_9AGAR|nr:hypothetical protein EV421DRAFT_1766800 [Armillaria borealis]
MLGLQIAANLGQGRGQGTACFRSYHHTPTLPMPQKSVDHNALRQAYLESPSSEGIYIGNPSGLSMHNLQWLPMDDGHGHVLVDTSHEAPSHAILLAVLRITEKDCWVYPDGKWKGPTQHTNSRADMKLRCSGAIPRAGVFRDDFQHVIRNLESIRNMIASPGSKKRGVLVPVEIGDPKDESGLKVQFQHVLFKDKPVPGVGGVGTRLRTRGQHRWNMDNWPVSSVAAGNALKDMKATHIVDPLPLYDSKGTAVHPELYTSSLVGATVEVRFNLCYWRIKDEDVYGAYVDNMCILPVPAQVLPSPAKKRRSVQAEHPLTPSKRLRRTSYRNQRIACVRKCTPTHERTRADKVDTGVDNLSAHRPANRLEPRLKPTSRFKETPREVLGRAERT